MNKCMKFFKYNLFFNYYKQVLLVATNLEVHELKPVLEESGLD